MAQHPTVLLLEALTLSLVCYIVFTKTRNALRRKRFAQENGCQPIANRYPLKDPIFGIDAVKELLDHAKEKKALELSLNRFRRCGTTFANKHILTPTIHTIEPENVKTVLSLRFKDYKLDRENTLGPVFGRGIFVTDGDMWANSRHMLRPNFAKEQVADIQAFERHVQTMFKMIPYDGSTVDLQELFFRLTIDTATEFLFGSSVESLLAKLNNDQGDTTESVFAEAFNFVQIDAATRFRMGAFVRFHHDPKAEKSKEIVWAYVDRFVDQAITYRRNADIEKKGDEQKYVFLHELATRTTDRKQLRDELLNILLAGRDTTASLLSNMFFMIAKRPEIWAKLRAEVAHLNGETPTYEQIKNMKYIRWCMNESLRLHPVVPGNSRLAIVDTVLPLGGGKDGQHPILVPAGTRILYTPYSMHRRKDFFGADADEFKPERWATLRPGWEYLPFNGGPRICLGQQYALTEASYVTARIAQTFAHLESRDGGPWREKMGLTLASLNGTQVGLYA